MTWYEDKQAELTEKQAGKSRQEVAAELKAESEHVFDPDTAVPQTHHWIQRGIKMSCEGAGHPPHQAWIPHAKAQPM